MSRSSKQQGFTLTELLVSLAIMGVILTIIIYNQSTYTEAASLSQTADGIASAATEAQTYGIAVKEVSPGSANFSAPYGLSLSLLNTSYKTSFISFVDRNNNQSYGGTWSCVTGGTEECLEKTALPRGNTLDVNCAITASGEDCDTPKRVDVSYLRPNLEPRITLFNSGGSSYSVSGLLGVRLKLKSVNNLMRSTSIYASGQISVQ